MTLVQREPFGTLPGSGETVEKFRLQSSSVTVEVLSLGCIVTALKTPDRAGRVADVVLGFDHLEDYLSKHPYFGAVIGRVANRIAKGKFTVEGKEYQLAINNGPNSIHGGIKGFDKMLWNAEVLPNGVRFSRISPDGEEGYPGELKVWVTYTLDKGELSINYRAQTDKTTPINLTNHSYFNLAGQASKDIYDHQVCIAAEAYLPVDDTMIPTGEIASVHDTLFDLRKPMKLGKQMEKLGGYDHNFCLDFSKDQCYCARVCHPDTGRVLEVSTTQPGLQFYTANFLDGSLKGKGGAVYPKHSAFCIETQSWPDAVNKSHFPSTLLRPGEEYNHTTCFKFSVA
ncbi:galactose mutarotase [Microcaecilia unicolor]|uniref:Aldose 1-epimerase n=1 Tax=Microcaecilia unicolor TaxID=1415580 RepID=A0A6P7XP46_9AMPH|nr:aldose 1-epimerase [Microcaecilia unicolor]